MSADPHTTALGAAMLRAGFQTASADTRLVAQVAGVFKDTATMSDAELETEFRDLELHIEGPSTTRISLVAGASAPGDRQGVVGESPIRRRRSEPRRPQAVHRHPRGWR